MWWVSRTAYDQLVNERDWLRSELTKAQDHAVRMERLTNGAPELPPKARKELPAMPKEIRDMINQWDSEITREHLEQRAYRSVARGKTWDDVKAILDQYEEEE
jgi:hypothetical protein